MMYDNKKRALRRFMFTALFAVQALAAQAQQTGGSVLIISGYSEVSVANDEARAVFFIEEQDADKTVAATRVNQKISAGTQLLKKQDPEARLATRDYYTYPIYATELSGLSGKQQTLTGWRVGQQVSMTTTNLRQLPATVAAAQAILGLNGLTFSLSSAKRQQLDAARLRGAYINLQERVSIIAHAMGRNSADAVIEQIDYEGDADRPELRMLSAVAPSMYRSNKPVDVAETSFDAGETNLSAKVVGRIRFAVQDQRARGVAP
jgi:uncharacterized protein YggE